MIPEEISAQNIIQAIEYIAAKGIENPLRKSKKWDLLYDGELFPPKYVISKAAEFSSFKRFLYHSEFVSNDARRFLTKRGFKIIPKDQFSDVVVLDDMIPENSKPQKTDLLEALHKLELLTPERKKKLMFHTNRNDTPLIRLVKKIYDYKCQMPGCLAEIRMKNGQNYCEVAHIEAFSNVMKTTPDNLIVLCPNHHKEFDYGERLITHIEPGIIRGTLNGRGFEFSVINAKSLIK